MRANRWFYIIVLLPLVMAAQPLADSAAAAYKKQEYKKCIEYYGRILADGQASPALYFNLGNAYFKDGQLGKAIYNYELAKKLSPGDDDIKTNLRLANSKTIDKIEAKENFLAGAIKSGVYNLFSTTGWAWLSIAAIAISLLCMALFIVSGKLSLRRTFFWLGAAGLVGFIIVFSVGYAALHDLTKRTQAIVTAPVVQVLNAPNESGKSKFSLHEGTRLTVLSSNDEWTSVQLANGNEGWIKTSELGLF